MLKSLHIENYALIRHTDIDFDAGFVAITGETGAGKSILLGALGMLLGQRADAKVLFDPQHKCIVEALFLLGDIDLRQDFDDNDVDYSDDGIVIVRRELLPNGKSRAFVNDTPVTVAFLRDLGARLIDIHSQHATLLLADSNFQTALLDSYGKGTDILHDYRNDYHTYTQLKQQLEQLTAEEQRNRKDYDYNKFLYDELSSAQLTDGEQETLEQEAELLSNAESIKQALSQVVTLCSDEEDAVLPRLTHCKNTLGKISDCHADLKTLHQRMESACIELDDIVASLEHLNDGITYSPERQQQVEERLDTIYRLEKKHNVDTVAQLIAIQDDLDDRLNQIDDVSQEIARVMEAVDRAYVKMQHSAEALTAARHAAATQMEHDIKPLLAELGMTNAELKVDIAPANHYTAAGADIVTTLFNANKGGQLRPLAKVASGGEMSRLMLAIKALSARATLLPTVIFDEIDAGISGDISVRVSRIMQQMAQSMQVIAITHLPQIAARANQHYKVFKATTDDDATASNIKLLSQSQRQHELAVMLSAEPPTEAALQTAAELMEL